MKKRKFGDVYVKPNKVDREILSRADPYGHQKKKIAKKMGTYTPSEKNIRKNMFSKGIKIIGD